MNPSFMKVVDTADCSTHVPLTVIVLKRKEFVSHRLDYSESTSIIRVKRQSRGETIYVRVMKWLTSEF